MNIKKPLRAKKPALYLYCSTKQQNKKHKKYAKKKKQKKMKDKT